jgi:hypothetical protein
MHKTANEGLKKWIEDFNRRTAEYNEWVKAFNSKKARNLEHWETLMGNHTWLTNEWIKLNKELHAASERFGPQIINFARQIIFPEGPRMPEPPPGYTFEQAMAASSRTFADPYHTNSPIPFKAKPDLKRRLMQTAIGYAKNYWKPIAYNAGVTAAGASLAALMALLAKKFLDKWQIQTNQIHENQGPLTTEHLEKTSAYIRIPPAVPYILG